MLFCNKALGTALSDLVSSGRHAPLAAEGVIFTRNGRGGGGVIVAVGGRRPKADGPIINKASRFKIIWLISAALSHNCMFVEF